MSLWLPENNFSVKLGGNFYVNCPVLVQFQDTPLFELARKDGYLSIDFSVFDQNGTKVAAVKRNNIYVTNGSSKDYSLEGDAERVALKNASGETLVEIRKRSAAGEVELDVSVKSYLPNGFLLDAGPEATNIGGVRMVGNTFENCAVGLQLA